MKKSFRVLLALAATSAVFVGFQNFTSSDKVIAPSGVTGDFDVRGGYLRKYTKNIKLEIAKCVGGGVISFCWGK